MVLPRATVLLAWLGLCCTAGCGAGLITGAIASNDGNVAPPPELNLTTRMPLVPAPDTTRTVVVANAQIPDATQVQVRLSLGADDSPSAVVAWQSGITVTPQGGSTTIRFTVETSPIAARFPDPTAQDVPVGLSVLVAGRRVAPVLPVTLLRQPVATLPATASRFLSSAGGTVVTLAATGLAATRAQDLQVRVTTVDPADRTRTIERACTNTVLTTGPDGTQVQATVPGNTFPGSASLQIIDPIAGQSRVVDGVHYRPDLGQVLPGRGATTGGTIVTLSGTALAALPAVPGQPPDFDSVELQFDKGGRTITLDRVDLLASESSLDRLVFRMPGSPDGRPGRVSVRLRVQLAGTVAEVERADVFLYANPDPVFGPRGAILDRAPVAITPITLEDPDGAQATDVAVLYSEGGVASVQLLLGEENGMFTRLGGPRRIGQPLQPAELEPRDLCDLDFDFDRVADLLTINRGHAGARHHLIRGQRAPAAPLGAVSPFLPNLTTENAGRCLRLDLSPTVGGQGRRGVVLLPHATAVGARPEVFVVTEGGPFEQLPDLPFVGERDAAAVFDVDDDGFLDFVAARGGLAPRLDLAFGDGTGRFGDFQTFDSLQVTGYTPAADSRVVGVHPCGEPGTRSIAVVFSGAVGGTPEPTIAVLSRLAGTRAFVHPIPAEVVLSSSFAQTGTTLGTSLAANLDGQGLDELVVTSNTLSPRLAVLGWDVTVSPARFAIAFVASGGAWDELENIADVRFGIAIPPPATTRALYVLHERDIDGQRERRLSTLLIGPGTALNPPTASGHPAVSIQAIVSGNFTPASGLRDGREQDLAFASPTRLSVSSNGGVGGFFGAAVDYQHGSTLLTETMTVVRPAIDAAAHRDALVALTADGRIRCWQPRGALNQATIAAQETSLGTDLRSLSPNAALHGATVSSASRLEATDVDGDGLQDLVAMLTFTGAQQDGDGLLLLLRGRATTSFHEFPFHDPIVTGPTSAATTHGNASSLAIGDFLRELSGPRILEVAVAVPTGSTPSASDGDHVRFYRYVAGSEPGADRFVRSHDDGARVLVAGSAPTLLRAADFDRDGKQDLLVACSGDGTLRLFLNSVRDGGSEVDVDAFAESRASPRVLLAGSPRFLRLADIDGDDVIDAFVVTEEATVPRRSHVAFYISSGEGRLELPVEVSPTRVDSLGVRLSVDLGDFNGDGVPDLLIGRDSGAGAHARMLFGGSR